MTIIEQIKAEIERRIRELDEQIVDIYDSKAVLRKDELQRLLSFLSALESENLIPKDLEEASSKFATRIASNGVSVEFLEEKLSFQEGAKWDREQIMKNAKDGWMDEEDVIILNDDTRIDLQPDYDKKPAFEFEYAQNVQVIILPKEN